LLQHEGKKFDCIPKPSPKLFKNFTYHQSGKIKMKKPKQTNIPIGKITRAARNWNTTGLFRISMQIDTYRVQNQFKKKRRIKSAMEKAFLYH
jgi:hypothetical protein